MTYYVYILASNRNGTLYVGVTNNLIRRVYEHKNNLVKGFTEKYGVHMLVHYESCESVESAIRREKQLKEWQRKWKLRLIEETNPQWRDLYDEIAPGFRPSPESSMSHGTPQRMKVPQSAWPRREPTPALSWQSRMSRLHWDTTKDENAFASVGEGVR